MRTLLAYSNIARPETADEGQEFINIKTQERFVFKDGEWHVYGETPSTPKQVLSEPSTPKEDTKKPASKKTTKKTTTKKETK